MPSITLPTLASVAGIASAGAGVAGALSGHGSSLTGTAPAGNTTSTQTQVPWSGQQPYLLGGFQQAGNLLNSGGPQYYPGQTLALPNQYQTGSIGALAQYGANPSQVQNAALNATADIASGNENQTNPGNATYTNAANGGLNVNTSGLYAPIATGQYQNTAGVPTLSALASGAQTNTAGTGPLSQIASGGFNIPGASTLNQFASGDYASASNPYFKNFADQVASQVQPQIDAQFSSGRLDSGLASRASAEGLAGALAPYAYQNYSQGLNQAQSAATSLGQLGLQGVGQQASAAGTLGQIGAQNLSTQLGAGEGLANIGQGNIGNILTAANSLTGIGQGNASTQLAGAQGLSNNFINGQNNQLKGISLAPQINQMPLTQIGALGTAGDLLQGDQQSIINAAMQRYNYNQQLPYNNLNSFIGQVQGNYGGTTTQTQPYFSNGLANGLSTALGVSQLLKGSGGPSALTNYAPANSNIYTPLYDNSGQSSLSSGLDTSIPNFTMAGF